MPTTHSRNAELMNTLHDLFHVSTKDGGDAVVVYRPVLRKVTGHTNAALLLNQMLHFYNQKHCQPFYKFIKPCTHPLYRPGDSWTEVLEWSYEEFSTALRKIGTKVTRGTSKHETYAHSMIIYWTNSSQVTYYAVNPVNIVRAVLAVYEPVPLGNSALSNYLATLQSLITWNSDLPELSVYKENQRESTQNTGSALNSHVSYPVPERVATETYVQPNSPGEDEGQDIHHHPLVQHLLYHFDAEWLSPQEQTMLRRPCFETVDGEKLEVGCITDHYFDTPGFQYFVEDVVPALAEIPDFTLLKAINFLRNFSKSGGTIPHWCEWQVQNPSKLKLDPEVEYAWLEEGQQHWIDSTSVVFRKNGEISIGTCM